MAYLDPETDQSHNDFANYLVPLVSPHQSFKAFGQLDVLSDVSLKSFDSVKSQNEPDFQRPEASSQRYLPMLEYRSKVKKQPKLS